MGRGSSGASGGGGAKAANKATEQTNKEVYNLLEGIVKSNPNFTSAVNAMDIVMSQAPIGTRIVVEYSSNAGQLQDIFVKGSNGWSETLKAKNGQEFWTAKAGIAEIYNAFSS